MKLVGVLELVALSITIKAKNLTWEQYLKIDLTTLKSLALLVTKVKVEKVEVLNE